MKIFVKLLFLFLLQNNIVQAKVNQIEAVYTGHNGFFTDLETYKGSLISVFREGKTHTSLDGRISVLKFDSNVTNFDKISTISLPNIDLRDPKIITSDKELFLLATGTYFSNQSNTTKPKRYYQSYLWSSKDAVNWTFHGTSSEINQWLWSLHHNNHGTYSISYSVGKEHSRHLKLNRLVQSQFIPVYTFKHKLLQAKFQPSETAITTLNDGTMVAIFRRKRGLNSVIGTAQYPYRKWRLRELPVSLEGQDLITTKNNKVIIAARDLRQSGNFMSVAEVMVNRANIKTILRVNPAKGDFAYPGIKLLENNKLIITYYNNGKIYAAAYQLP